MRVEGKVSRSEAVQHDIVEGPDISVRAAGQSFLGEKGTFQHREGLEQAVEQWARQCVRPDLRGVEQRFEDIFQTGRDIMYRRCCLKAPEKELMDVFESGYGAGVKGLARACREKSLYFVGKDG